MLPYLPGFVMSRIRQILPILALPVWLPSLQAVDFVHEIAPVLKKHCAECHMGEKHKGGLSMNTREDLMKENDDGFVLEPGSSKKSLMMHLITSDDEDERMPPKGDGLGKEEVALIAAWIDAGAPWEPGFTFKKQSYEPPLKPRRPELPPVADGRAHPIDRILDAHMSKEKTRRPEPIDDAGFVRRVHLDITGVVVSESRIGPMRFA